MAEQLLSTDPGAGRLLSEDPAARDAPASAMTARQSGFGASDRTDDAPSGIAAWFETKLRPMLEQVAHPKTISDIAALLVPDQGLTASVRAGAKAVGSVGQAATTAGQGVVRAGGAAVEAIDPDLLAIASPRAGAVVKKAQQVRAALQARAAAAAADVPVVTEAAVPVATTGPAARAAVVDEFTAARSAKASAARQPGAGTLPDQKALNDAALAERRAAYQATQAGAPAPLPPVGAVVKESGKMQLTAPEMKEFARLLKRGLSLEDSLTAVKSARALAAKLGGATDAQVAAAVAHRGATGAW